MSPGDELVGELVSCKRWTRFPGLLGLVLDWDAHRQLHRVLVAGEIRNFLYDDFEIVQRCS